MPVAYQPRTKARSTVRRRIYCPRGCSFGHCEKIIALCWRLAGGHLGPPQHHNILTRALLSDNHDGGTVITTRIIP
jgi:hypothetical protein